MTQKRKHNQIRRAISLFLAIVTLIGAFSVLALPTSAANYSTNYSSYNQPEDNDYARRGAKGSGTVKDEIKWIQAALNYLIKYRGLNASYLDVDGSFGPATEKATKAYQKAYGLSADGSFGPASIQKMKQVLSGGTVKYNLVWPVKGLTTGGITGKYGYDGGSAHYRPLGTTNQRIHSGIDIANGKIGSKILATAAGEVVLSGYSDARGNYVVIYHSDLNISSLYEHLKSGSITVKKGDKVYAGQEIAQLGNTGRYKNDSGKWVGYSAHLHFGLMYGKATYVDYDVWKVNKSTNSFSPDPRYNSNVSYTFK